MIYVTGDSHSMFTFDGVPGTKSVHIGPVTMKRMGYLEDELLPTTVRQIGLGPGDALIVSCGEGDVRCFIHPQLEHRAITMTDLLQSMVDRYITRVCTLDVNGARAGILSVPPPAPSERTWNMYIPPSQLNVPPAGTNGDRVLYTRTLNAMLASGCAAHGLVFVDVYSLYADPYNGMLPMELSDGCVHIKDTSRVPQALAAAGLQ